MKKIVLCILDGCGVREEKDGNAFANANKPNKKSKWQQKLEEMQKMQEQMQKQQGRR